MNIFGITEKTFKLIVMALDGYPEIEETVIFGSRAKGSNKNGSDIDLAIKGKACTNRIALELSGKLNEELPIPYHVDVVDYGSLEHKELKDHIDRAGSVFHTKSNKGYQTIRE